MLQVFGSKKTPPRPILAIISDKTEDITSDEITVHAAKELPGSQAPLMRALALAVTRSPREPVTPLDTALAAYVATSDTLLPSSSPIVTYPFDPNTSMSGNAWHHGREYELALKGAPEVVLLRCDLSEEEREKARFIFINLAAEGHQVIAVAHARATSAPDSLHELKKMSLVGFVAVTSTLAPGARQGIQNALSAGLMVRLLTGNHAETAFSIGRRLGIATRHSQVVDTQEFHFMNEKDRETALQQATIFARATPRDKRLITALLEEYYDVRVITRLSPELATITKTARRHR